MLPNSYLQSVIIPVHNAEQWLDEALSSISKQSWKDSLEVSLFNDASTVSIKSLMSMFIVPIVITDLPTHTILLCDTQFQGKS